MVIVCGLAGWIWSRWDVWFHNTEELPYTAASTPHWVLLTFGDKDEQSRNVSWQCDSIVQPSWLELVSLRDSDTIRIEAQGEVFRSRSGQAAYYVARLRQLQPDCPYSYRAISGDKTSAWYRFHTWPSQRDQRLAADGGGVEEQGVLQGSHQRNREPELPYHAHQPRMERENGQGL